VRVVQQVGQVDHVAAPRGKRLAVLVEDCAELNVLQIDILRIAHGAHQRKKLAEVQFLRHTDNIQNLCRIEFFQAKQDRRDVARVVERAAVAPLEEEGW